MLAGSSPTRRLVARSISQSRRHYVQLPGPRCPLWPSPYSLSQPLRWRAYSKVETSTSLVDGASKTEISSARPEESLPPQGKANFKDEAELKAYVEGEAEEDDDWSSIVALEASRNKLDWRRKLVTDEEYEFESDLDNSPGSVEKLVDSHESDLELWQELFLYRLRTHGDGGGEAVSKHLLPVADRHNLRLWELPRLWRALESLALRRSQILTELTAYVSRMSSNSGDGPEDYYRKVMFHVVTEDAQSTSQWHERLHAVLPEREESKLLFDTLCGYPEGLQVFSQICFNIPSFTRMYSFVITCLVKKGRFGDILWWHAKLLQHNDVPSAFSTVKLPIEQMAKSGHVSLASQITDELTALGCRNPDTALNSASFIESSRSHSVSSHAEMFQDNSSHQRPTDILRTLIDDGQTHLSDNFVGRLFATQFFSLDTIIQGLRAIHQDAIGPVSFQAIIIRIADHGRIHATHIHEAIEQLRTGKLGIKSCPFSRLIFELAQKGDNDLIDKIMGSGEHPDVFGDLDLQKARFSAYVEEGNQEGANTTSIVLRFGHSMSKKVLFDIQMSCLADALSKNDQTAIALQFKAILANGTRVAPSLFDQVWMKLIRKRNPDGSARNHAYAVSFLKHLMKNDNLVHPSHWKEVLKRLASARQLQLLYRTTHWLVFWTQHQEQVGKCSKYGNKFLNSVFDEATAGWIVRSGLEWHYVDKNKKADWRHQYLLGTHDEKVEILMKDRALFGIRLLRSLKNHGLSEILPMKIISVACERILRNFFGPLRITSLRFRAGYDAVRRCRRAELADYAAAIEEIWGEEIFWTGLPGSRYDRLQNFAKFTVRMGCIQSKIDDVAEGLHFVESELRTLHLKRRIYATGREVDWEPLGLAPANAKLLKALSPDSKATQEKKTRRAAMEEQVMRKRLLYNINRLPFVDTDWIICEYYPDYATAYLCRPVPVARDEQGMIIQRYPDYAITNLQAMGRKVNMRKISPSDRATNLDTTWFASWSEDQREKEETKEDGRRTEDSTRWKPVVL